MRTVWRAAAGLAALAVFLALPALWGAVCGAGGSGAFAVSGDAAPHSAAPEDNPAARDGGEATADEPGAVSGADSGGGASALSAVPDELRAVWVSYLEWQEADFSGEASFRADADAMMRSIADLGANTVFAQVRPFADALYPSAYFPFSHLCGGAQGQSPGFDPLAVLVETAHDNGLRLEAWINPYRVQVNGSPTLCAQSPAVLHPDWVREADGGRYLNPASAEVQAYLADAVRELCQNYAVDGVHFDDYFYPTTDPAFDADDYAASGTALSLDDWRRQNVNDLLRQCRDAAHEFGVPFGVSPQGRPDACRDGQYSDAALWLAEGGYCDYLLPQLYWGLDYRADGDDALALQTLAEGWLALPRAEGVRLGFGLGAYRIGAGDGGDRAGPGTEWCGGGALARQIEALRADGAWGAALYRYDSLFANALYPTLAAQEADAVRAAWGAAG